MMKTIGILGLAFALCASTCLHARGRTQPRGSLRKQVRIEKLDLNSPRFQRPSDLLTSDQIYQKYFGKGDSELFESYRSGAWGWDERYRPYYPWVSRSLLVDSNFFFNQRVDLDRSSRARDIVRSRIDHFIRTYINGWKHPKPVRAVQMIAEKTKNVPIAISSENKRAGEIRLGYDILSDSSRIEYANGPIEGGIYHPELFAAATGTKPKLGLTSVSLNSNFGQEAPRANLGLPLTLQYLLASISKNLSPVVSLQISKRQPLFDRDITHDYEIRVVWSF